MRDSSDTIVDKNAQRVKSEAKALNQNVADQAKPLKQKICDTEIEDW